jgi:hypothetical protein
MTPQSNDVEAVQDHAKTKNHMAVTHLGKVYLTQNMNMRISANSLNMNNKR